MLIKLAFKNIGKSFRDYAVYFLTLVLGVCIFYMFNSIYAQQELMESAKCAVMETPVIVEMLSYISVFVAVVLGFLIVYANNFFIKRRAKELGIYMTLGMTKNAISTILILETALMAVVALVVGLLLGVFGSQFMSVFTAKLFEADLTGYKFIFSAEAAGKSVLYFAIIFLVVILFNTFVIQRAKLIDLLYGGRKNEILKIKSTAVSLILFVVSIAMLAAAYYNIIKFDFGPAANEKYLKIALILGAVGTFLFFFSLSGFLIKLLQSRKKLYYKNLNMFVIKQLNSKINTNFVSMSIVCIVLFLVIVVFSAGYCAQNILSSKLREQVMYDFTLENINYSDETDSLPEIYSSLSSDLQNSGEIKDFTEYALMKSEESGGKYGDYDLDFSAISTDIRDSSLYFMKLSEFNQLRRLNGLSPYTLTENSCLITYEDESLSVIARQFNHIKIGDNELKPMKKAENITFGNRYFGGIVFVVEDGLTAGLPVQKRMLNINCTDENASLAFQRKLQNYWESGSQNSAFMRYDSKLDIYAGKITDKATASFLAIYLGFVFMIACAAVLSVQQLAEAADNRERYSLLRKLGTEKKMLDKALFTQIFVYFSVPLSLAIVHSIVGLNTVYNLLLEFGNVNIASGIAASAGFVIIIYGAYFALTYAGCKNIIKKTNF